MPDNDDLTVHYGVKELLAEIKDAIAEMRGMLSTKADRTDIETLHRRIDETHSRIDHEASRTDELEKEVEHRRRVEQETSTKAPLRQNLWMIVLTLLVLAVGIIQVVK